MTHRHLLPDEIDQLLDGEVGFGVAPLEAHVKDCPECQAALDEARVVVEALETLPLLSPSPAFADRVLSEVHVYVPWYMAARDAAVAAVRPLAPRSRPVQVLLGACALSIAFIVSAATVWLVGHLDATVFLASVYRTRAVGALSTAGSAVASALFGAPAASFLAHGSAAVLLGSVLLYGMVLIVAAVLLRTVAVARHRARS
jgi:hypothetical protein